MRCTVREAALLALRCRGQRGLRATGVGAISLSGPAVWGFVRFRPRWGIVASSVRRRGARGMHGVPMPGTLLIVVVRGLGCAMGAAGDRAGGIPGLLSGSLLALGLRLTENIAIADSNPMGVHKFLLSVPGT